METGGRVRGVSLFRKSVRSILKQAGLLPQVARLLQSDTPLEVEDEQPQREDLRKRKHVLDSN